MESSSGNTSKSSTMVTMAHQRKSFEGIKMENPFSFKVLQVFGGFGFGCGVGIGVGSPVNLGRMPVVGEVMSATRGATDAFSGVARHVNTALSKFGAKQVQAGFGCGVGFGYGFGVGLAVKPSVMQQIQSHLVQAMKKLMMKFGMASNPSINQSVLPTSLQSGVGMIKEPSSRNPVGNVTHMATEMPESASQVLPDYGSINKGSTHKNLAGKSTPVDTTFGRTEKVSNLLQNPVLREEGIDLNEVCAAITHCINECSKMHKSVSYFLGCLCKTLATNILDESLVSIMELAGRLRSENNLLQMVLKHQQIIDELMEENKKLSQILVDDLKIPPSKLQASSSSRIKPACADCFDCRRKQRKK